MKFASNSLLPDDDSKPCAEWSACTAMAWPLSASSERAERGRDGPMVNGKIFPLEAV